MNEIDKKKDQFKPSGNLMDHDNKVSHQDIID